MDQTERNEVECGTEFRTAMIWHLPTTLFAGDIPFYLYIRCNGYRIL